MFLRSSKHIEELEVMDRSLLKYIFNFHSKVQNYFLYLETGIVGIKQIITSRRCFYLHTQLKRDIEELTKKVYIAQKNKTHQGIGYWWCKSILKIWESHLKKRKSWKNLKVSSSKKLKDYWEILCLKILRRCNKNILR